MEADKPVYYGTPNENIDLKMIDLQSFNINLGNKNYIFDFVKIENKKYIIYKVREINNLNNKEYSLYLSINDFHKLNVLFNLYETIDGIYIFLLDIIIAKKYTLSIKENLIILVFHFSIPGKTVDINFELKETKLSQEKIIDGLSSKVEELLKENQLIKNEQEKIKNELTDKNNELNEYKYIKEENIQIKNKLINIEEYFSNLKEVKNSSQYYDFDESHIIKNNEEKYKLKKWISINWKIKKINLLYSTTEDGDNGKSFYEKCSCKESTISLIKTKKGRRFGGFSKAEWKNASIILEDNNAFLFSLDNKKKNNI